MHHRSRRVALSATWVGLSLCAFLGLAAPSAQANFGLQSFHLSAAQAPPSGSPPGALGPAAEQAGSHPYAFTTSIRFNRTIGSTGEPIPDGDVKDLEVELPPGFVGDPFATPKCTIKQFSTPNHNIAEGLSGADCPNDSQVGVVQAEVTPSGHGSPLPLSLGIYNLVSPPGVPAQFGFKVLGDPIVLTPTVRTGGDYGLTVSSKETNQTARIFGATTTFWGVPADPSHEGFRGECLGSLGAPFGGVKGEGQCSVETPRKPFLRLPTSCPLDPLGEPIPFSATLRADSWQEPATWVEAQASNESEGQPLGITGCERLDFAPTISLAPDTAATDSPAGLHVDLHLPQNQNPDGFATADLRDATVTLPAGLTVNPASANGLAACTPAQIGLTSAPGANPPTYTPGPATCPDAAKIGTVEIDTPLLEHPLPGAVYVAQPRQNPFGSLLALYIAINDPQSGIVLKLAGRVEADPLSGRLITTFPAAPQLPFEDFQLDFFGGPGAALRTATTCGNFQTTTDLTPWSSPEAPDATPSSSFALASGPGGTPCPAGEPQQPNNPSFDAGTTNPIAGSYSPFVIHLSRSDGSQNLARIDATLPPGLLGRLAGVGECPDVALSAAAQHTGAEEQATPSCPPASELGKVTVGAGAGPGPYYVTGRAYLAGPYRGAPLSLAIITPAVAGPYDLGTVLVRSALQVNPETAQITAVSDPIPQILQGIPLDVRSIALNLDRPNFTLNPTSCDPFAIIATALSTLGQPTALTEPFQVGACNALAFKPHLALSLKGPTNRTGHPALNAVLTYPKKGNYANIATAQVTLPHSEFLDNAHIGTVCTRVQFNEGAGNGAECPPASVYGHATAITPLLDQPLTGPVYLRSSNHKLPDLVAALNGQIQIALDGRVDTGRGGGIRNTFEVVPDAPVTKFTLEMAGGKKGLLENSENLCSPKAKTHAEVNLTAQNGKVYDTTPEVQNSCKKKGGKGKKHHAHKGGKAHR